MTLSQAERVEIETAAHRYFAGRMSEAEEEAFEVRMLEDPEVAREAEATQHLRAGLRRLRADGEIGTLTRARQSWYSPPMLAAAAAVLIVVMSSLFYFARVTQPVSVLAKGSAGTVAGTYLIAQRRGANTDVVIQKAGAGASVRLDVLPTGVSPTGEYQLALSPADAAAGSNSLGKLRVHTGDQGLITAYLDVSRLSAGRYVLTVTPDGAAGASESMYTLVLKD